MPNNGDVCNALGRHEAAKQSADAFIAGTVRLPHVQDREAYQDDGEGGFLWLRNCVGCSTTLTLVVPPCATAEAA